MIKTEKEIEKYIKELKEKDLSLLEAKYNEMKDKMVEYNKNLSLLKSVFNFNKDIVSSFIKNLSFYNEYLYCCTEQNGKICMGEPFGQLVNKNSIFPKHIQDIAIQCFESFYSEEMYNIFINIENELICLKFKKKNCTEKKDNHWFKYTSKEVFISKIEDFIKI